MSLDARKTLHVLQAVTRSFAGRQRSVVVVYLTSGSYSYGVVQVIMRSLHTIDPQIFDTSGQALSHTVDTLLIAPLGTSFMGAVFVADTTSATSSAVAAAPKYEIVEAQTVGMVTGGSHIRVSLRRMR